MSVILIVDDDAMMRETLVLVLRHVGFEVCEASNGNEALQILGHHPCDLLLTDICMPKLDGKRLIETLRSQQASIPIVAMSASLENCREALVALGVCGMLAKPFRYDELVTLLRGILSA